MSDDRQSLDGLLAAQQDRVFRIALGVAGRREDAEDIMQEVLLIIARNIKSFRGDSALTTWIYRITLRTAIAWLARHRRAEGDSRSSESRSGEGRSSEGELSRAESSEPRAIGSEVPGSDARIDIARAMARLPLNARTTLLLVAVEGLSHAEAAQLLDIPEGTVASRVHHARAQLRAMLG